MRDELVWAIRGHFTGVVPGEVQRLRTMTIPGKPKEIPACPKERNLIAKQAKEVGGR
ncbi:MAG: hypothetical protein HY892_03990 [Deltaproteobacteria bacterium]|nr:hypothetical protein [Deltaproteobacteria bacterium]